MYGELSNPNKPPRNPPETTTSSTTPTTTETSPVTTTETTSTTPTTAAAAPPGVSSSELLGGDAGDIAYPYYLVNGRIAASPKTFNANPGQRIRIRLINTASDTAFRVALAGHSMTVTHTDGYPVVPLRSMPC